jgi:hypothetical protein
LTEQQTWLAVTIDTHVREVLAHDGGDKELLMSLADHMGTFTQVLDTYTGADINALCDRYDGFSRFARLLERLAEGIAYGSIAVPK